MITPTRAQVLAARSIVRKKLADGDVPNPATVAIAKFDLDALSAIAERLSAQAETKPKAKRRRKVSESV